MGSFTDGQSNSIYWFNKASDLLGSAAAVHYAIHNEDTFPKDRYGLSRGFRMAVACPLTYRMLWGMALEALLKAVVVERGAEIRHTHNLNQLARDALVRFKAEQQKTLQILSDTIYWDGRYPVPKNQQQWDDLSELKRETLNDKTPLAPESQIHILTPNDRLSWESLQVLWSRPMDELCNLANWIQQ